MRYGLLTVIRDEPSIKDADGKNLRMVLTQCQCGGERVVRFKNLASGNTKSCGCLKRAALAKSNAKRSEPQAWTVEGDIGSITINGHQVLVDAEDVPLVSAFRWYMDANGYVDSTRRHERIAMHRLVLGLKQGDATEVDHKHRVTWDNRKSQLRLASSSQNKMNRRGNSASTSRFKGVSWDSERQCWVAQINSRHLGRFALEEDAARAYDAAAAQCFGSFAYLNNAQSEHGHASNCN